MIQFNGQITRISKDYTIEILTIESNPYVLKIFILTVRYTPKLDNVLQGFRR